MTDTIAVAIIANVGSVAAAFIIHMGQRDIKAKVEKVAKQTDGITSALVAATGTASHAKGVQDEKIRVAVKENRPLDTVISGPKIGIIVLLSGVLGAILEHAATKL